jgi:hypothetical protein
MNTQFQDVFDAKDQRRKELAALPYVEKLKLLLKLQRMADVGRAARGLPPKAWPFDPETLERISGNVDEVAR